jgi:hypothetical protein
MQSLFNLNTGNEELLIAANDSNASEIEGDGSVVANDTTSSKGTGNLLVATKFNNETYDINKKPTYPIFHY